MAWRFKASKYKNAAPIVPKPEACVRDICVGSYQTYGNNIAASAAFMAFNVDHNGSNLAVLPIDDCGRKSKTMPLLHAHSDTVTDMAFSPFHDGLLATGSQDCLVKIWHIPEKGLEESLSQPECIFSHKQRRVETVSFHPTADFLLTSTSFATVTFWDLTTEQETYSNSEAGDVVQSLSWRQDGTLLSTTCKDKQVRISDPRANKVTHCANSHQGLKDSRVVWLGDPNKIITTGFDAVRLRQVFIRDIRNFEEPEKVLQLDSSTGILVPLFDVDTNMLFLAGKGDITISYLEVIEREPFLVEGLRHTGEQTKGACLVPKRALSVMQAEVNRLLQLTSTSVIPITYQVPRKSYRDFHGDLFPDTAGPISTLSAQQWMAGENKTVAKISLDPAKKQSGISQPRLGPRPFTPPKLNVGADGDQKSNEFSFDKVFSVPSVPEMNGSKKTPPQNISEPLEKLSVNCDNKDDNNEDDEAHTPTTAERRRLFEQQINQDGDKEVHSSVSPANVSPAKTPTTEVSPSHSANEEVTAAEDDSCQITSIAERRLYENRSMSVQEPSSTSPTPLRRRDSLKGANTHETIKEEPVVERVKPLQRQNSLESKKDKKPELATPTPKRTSTVFGRVSKFRHLKGTIMPKATHIENIRNLSQQLPKECDGFQANPKRVAVPLSGPGGKIAIFELSNTGKLPDGVIPTLVNGTSIMDFVWDPFDYSRLAVACDDGTIRLWHVPENGLKEPTNEASSVLSGHAEKIYFLRFHPLARDVLATGSFDLTIRIWDLKEGTEQLQLEGHTDQIFSFAWSPCGKFCATMCKDTKLRVFEPRKGPKPIAEGVGTEGLRGARVVWALDGTVLVVAGFDKISERQIVMFKAKDLRAPLATVGLDVSPAILIPFYDEDSSTIFLTGKGDSTVYVYEVTEEPPYLCPLSHHRSDTLHQGLSFLPKNACNISGVEFAKALRLTNNTIKPISYAVPRIKSDLFQDDLFPPTKVTWEPTMEASEWFGGANKQPQRISLQPEGMDSLSESQPCNNGPSEKPTVKTESVNTSKSAPFGWQNDYTGSVKETQEQIQKAVSSRMEVNLKLEQDDMEGVEEKEWDE